MDAAQASGRMGKGSAVPIKLLGDLNAEVIAMVLRELQFENE